MVAPDSASFADVLERFRKAAGLTQEELAQRAQLSRNAINALERGARQSPRKDTVALLASALALLDEQRPRTLGRAARRTPGGGAPRPNANNLHVTCLRRIFPCL